MKTGSPAWPTPGRRSKNGGRITISGVRTARWAIGRPRSSRSNRRPRAMEKTAIQPPWKTLRVYHFPTAPAAVALSCPTHRDSHYDWTKNGGHITASLLWRKLRCLMLRKKRFQVLLVLRPNPKEPRRLWFRSRSARAFCAPTLPFAAENQTTLPASLARQQPAAGTVSLVHPFYPRARARRR